MNVYIQHIYSKEYRDSQKEGKQKINHRISRLSNDKFVQNYLYQLSVCVCVK